MGGEEIQVNRAPSAGEIERMTQWPTWGCAASEFEWTYSGAETCYIVEGEVTVTPDDGREAVTVGKGDMVVFPDGMSCTWKVKRAIKKHYRFS
ncbi:hypothetical protein KFE25_010725 [Diacronema lutheri]|uniref:(S)-ureidoglycine aminohydrolase cupin domain-containing protein n=1 Tax=Diacronema lutheri TaxID=2081491 RepID=A0A8J6C5D4_DIALT|nr:hypothetical protein KFE25_010725 [Diacronema lutheri]